MPPKKKTLEGDEERRGGEERTNAIKTGRRTLVRVTTTDYGLRGTAEGRE